MTKEDKIKAFEMRLDGYTFEEIGKHFGLSRQCIYQMLSVKERRYAPRKQHSIYPKIDLWLFNNNMTWVDLNEKVKIGCLTQVQKVKTGKAEPRLNLIKKILNFTGLTFEEAFGEVLSE